MSPIIYILVHYDFSQIEYVAPFLEKYKSKVFIYNWHGLKQKMVDYYSLETKVFDFSLKNIIKCILEEKDQVVFLQTASLAYGFGQYQKEALLLIKKLLPERVWGVSVIGHCMYGCMSCKGNDHKVPVYFTRYFKKSIPYNASFIQQQFQVSKISVLCAPSYGETSLLQERAILEYFKQLQDDKKFEFVFKFHPAVYDENNYLDATKEELLEKQSVEYIKQNFKVTKESEPCLLPFFEAFDVIFCDLHSSVPFIASYFAPKAIVCYWNDDDYEVPAGRDPEFLKNLTVYKTLDELKSFLSVPLIKKGDQSFFFSMYGKVDGNEVDRFAKLANWPTDPGKPCLLTLNEACSKLVNQWLKIYANAEEKEDALKAIGISLESTIKIMTFNLWNGTEGCLKLEAIQKAAKSILQSQADVVCCQECASRGEHVPGTLGSRTVCLDELSQTLSKLSGKPWKFIYQGFVSLKTPSPIGILTNLEIISKSKSGFGVQLCKDKNFWVFNTHLPYLPYQPYQLVIPHIEYEGFGPLDPSEAADSCLKSRGQEIKQLVEEIETKDAVFVCGDFNEPSHLDWNFKGHVAGLHPCVVEWPCTYLLQSCGFRDSFRDVHPDNVLEPGYTWIDKKSDRIDFVFYKNCKSIDSQVYSTTEWVSDHLAVLSTFSL